MIGDFRSGEDVIDLHFTVPLPPAAYAEAATSNTDYASALTVAESLIGGGRVAVYVAGAADGWLFWDSVGDGVIDQAVVLKGANSLAAFGTYDII